MKQITNERRFSLLAMAYLDNSATTPVCEAAAKKAMELMQKTFGNPASVHSLGMAAEQEVENARGILARALGAQPEEVYFTSGGTEGNNLAILGAVAANRRKGNRVITTVIEHPSVLKCFDRLEEDGFDVVRLPVDKNGRVRMEDLQEAVDEKTVLISMMLVNNETGAIQPVDQIAGIVKSKKAPALIHTDCVQAFGKLPFSVKGLQVDLLTVSGHKIHAPKGVGALYIKKGTRILPQTYGGGQEKGLRSGTVAVSQIGSFAAAVELLPLGERGVEHADQLRRQLLDGLANFSDVCVNSPLEGSPFIVNLSVPGIPSEVMIRALEMDQVYVSGGSACAKGGRSHVLMAQGLSTKEIDSALRISFSHHTTTQDVEQLLLSFGKAYGTLHRKR